LVKGVGVGSKEASDEVANPENRDMERSRGRPRAWDVFTVGWANPAAEQE
jgi:hypothetical protein